MRALVLLALTTTAYADVKLTLEHEPMPRTLKMRRAAQAQPPAMTVTKKATPMPQAPKASATDLNPITGLEGIRDVKQPVSFSLSVGYQIDGARPTGKATLGGTAPVTGVDYETLRSYGFAEGFLSTRGVGLQSLSSYFSVRFQAARRLAVAPDDTKPDEKVPLASPIATWFERSGAELRTGWAEVKDFLPKRWGLSRLRLRVGDQFIYAPWIVHMVGYHIAYEGPTVTVSLFNGFRRSDYTRAQEDTQPLTFGGTFRFDLRGITKDVPIAIDGEYLQLSDPATNQPTTASAQLQFDWRPKQDTALIGAQRWLDGKNANQRLEFRTRLREVTNIGVELMNRREDDWRWDPTLVERDRTDPIEARRYLDLGPPRPQLLFSVRGGTLIAENIDLFARIAASNDQSNAMTPPQTFTARYLELGGAAELRLRRTVAIGASVLTRTTERKIENPITDTRNTADPLPESAAMGDQRFVEAGLTTRMTLGARKFSALLELYGRRTHYAEAYVDPLLPVEPVDLRGGMRFAIDAWVGKRVRLYASYDVSSALQSSPEITGYKALRLTLTGVY